MSKYDKEIVIGEMIRRGLKPTKDPSGTRVSELAIPKDMQLGINTLGKLDFLRDCGIHVYRLSK